MKINKFYYKELPDGSYVSSDIPQFEFNSSSGRDWYLTSLVPRGSSTGMEGLIVFHTDRKDLVVEYGENEEVTQVVSPWTHPEDPTIYETRVESNFKLVESERAGVTVNTPSGVVVLAMAVNRGSGEYIWIDDLGNSTTPTDGVASSFSFAELTGPYQRTISENTPGKVHEWDFTVPAGYSIIGFYYYFEVNAGVTYPNPALPVALAGMWLYGTQQFAYDPEKDKALSFSFFNPETPFDI